MDLYVLRHGIAEEKSAGQTDADRALTKEGEKKMKRIAKAMKEMGLEFDTILSSPYRRARETAEIVADVFDCEDNLKFTETLAGGSGEKLIEELATEHSRSRGIVIVGHEPSLSRLISMLVGGRDDMEITMKKGGICKLSVKALRYDKCASLDWLVGPAQLLQ